MPLMATFSPPQQQSLAQLGRSEGSAPSLFLECDVHGCQCAVPDSCRKKWCNPHRFHCHQASSTAGLGRRRSCLMAESLLKILPFKKKIETSFAVSDPTVWVFEFPCTKLEGFGEIACSHSCRRSALCAHGNHALFDWSSHP